MKSNGVKMNGLRRFLTAQHPTKYLLFVLIGVWVWLWAALEYPPLFTYLGYTLIALVFLWMRPFSPFHRAIGEYSSEPPKHQGQENRRFLTIIATISVLPVVFTLRADPKTAALIFALVCLAT